MKNPPPIESIFRKVDLLVDDISRTHKISKESANLLKEELNELMISVHNIAVKEMKTHAIEEITKTLEKYEFRR